MKKNNKVKRLSKEEFLARVADNWMQFRDRMSGVSYDDFVSESMAEWEKQNKMSDVELKRYRDNMFKDAVNETKKVVTEEELKKLEEADAKTVIEGEK